MSFTESVDAVVTENRNHLLSQHPTWERVRLGDIAQVLNGFPFPSTEFSATGPGTPLIRIRDILRNSTETFFCGEYAPEFLVGKGDLLVGMDGDFNSSIWTGGTGLLNQRCCKIQVAADWYDKRLLAYCLPGYLSAINARTSSVTVKHLSSGTIADIPLPLPPVAEQQRIADALDELLSDLDEGVAALERARAKLKLYRAAVLKAAVEGALTADWRAQHPDAEPASELLQRILVERRRRWESAQLAKYAAAGKPPPKNWKAKYKQPAAPDTGDLPELPNGWCWASVDQLISSPICNGISVRGSDVPPGVAALRLNAMGDQGFDYTKRRYLPLAPERVDDLWVRAGDFFVSRGNGSKELVGRGTLAQEPGEQIIFPDTMMRLRLNRAVQRANWVPAVWHSIMVRVQVEKAAKTTAGIWKISQPDVARFTIPLPPAAEQVVITDAADEQLSTIARLDADLAAKLQSAQGLRQAILRDAFAGRLEPQDPHDEPASELLKRIAAARAERERAAKAAKKAGKATRRGTRRSRAARGTAHEP